MAVHRLWADHCGDPGTVTNEQFIRSEIRRIRHQWNLRFSVKGDDARFMLEAIETLLDVLALTEGHEAIKNYLKLERKEE
jgi:hypothetical protein